MSTSSSFIEFAQRFSTEEACLQHLHDMKWSDGYHCRRCGHNRWVKGRRWHHRRCQKCFYDESATAHTLFHKLRFSIVKAFWITYQLSTMKKGLSSCEISRQYEIHQETAWFFKRKVQQAMGQAGGSLLKTNVEVDETVIGGFEKGRPGRSHGQKKKVQVAVEVEYPEDDDEPPKMKRAASVTIENYSAEALKKGLDQMVDEDALVTTDGWRAYREATSARDHDVLPSAMGEAFKQLHWYIFNLKNWLRGIHHKVSAKHIKHYLNEFVYRFNRRNYIEQCPLSLLKTMAQSPWLSYKMATEA